MDGLEVKGMTWRVRSGARMDNSQSTTAELGPRREKNSEPVFTNISPHKASSIRVGPRQHWP
jgi:hypothetical protein